MEKKTAKPDVGAAQKSNAKMRDALQNQPRELGGPKDGHEPVKYSKDEGSEGDWQTKGRCTDF